MKRVRIAIFHFCMSLSLVGCGGGHLSVGLPEGEQTLDLYFPSGRAVEHRLPRISGGIRPYESSIEGCPDWVTLFPDQGILAGTGPAVDSGKTFFCTFRVTESDPGFRPARSVSYGLRLVVESPEARGWRFRTRTVEPGQGLCILPGTGPGAVATLPRAHGGEGSERYELPGAPHPPAFPNLLSFDPRNRVLAFANPGAIPVLGTPNTYRYLVGAGTSVDATNADDALCLDVQINRGADICPEDTSVDPPLTSDYFIHIQLRLRDDAFWDRNAEEYRCPDTTALSPRSGTRGVSNPVHEALAPVHARRAAAVASAAVRDRVGRWSPGSEQASFAVAPEVGLASLSGQRDGFDYTGVSESATFGAETGAGAWQAGLVASFTRTELRYRAEAALAELGYRTGEHDTETLSLHPFVAWHAPTGGHLWASLGAGSGRLRHRDDLGFPSSSDSDVRLFAHAVGAAVPLADVLSGKLQTEASIESFDFDIKGGEQISSSLPTMRGLDYRAGLAWSAPVVGAPSVSIAYKHLTGDGPEGGELEARGSVSVEGVFHPRLSLNGNAGGSFGLGDHEQDFWRLGGGVRFAPDSLGRGFGLELDARLVSLAAGPSAGVGIRSEAGYGLWSDSLFGTIRPYVGLIRHSGDRFVGRIFGLDLGGTSNWPIKIEVHDHSSDPSLAFKFSLRHRF